MRVPFMSKFLNELHICPHPDDDDPFYLTEPLVYQTDLLVERVGNDVIGTRITVPKGFLTDLATTRRIPLVNSVWGWRAHREAVVHDYLGALDAEPQVTYDQWNDIFLEAMESRGKPWWVKYPMHIGVCIGAWPFWKKKPIELYTPPSGSCDDLSSVKPSGD